MVLPGHDGQGAFVTRRSAPTAATTAESSVTSTESIDDVLDQEAEMLAVAAADGSPTEKTRRIHDWRVQQSQLVSCSMRAARRNAHASTSSTQRRLAMKRIFYGVFGLNDMLLDILLGEAFVEESRAPARAEQVRDHDVADTSGVIDNEWSRPLELPRIYDLVRGLFISQRPADDAGAAETSWLAQHLNIHSDRGTGASSLSSTPLPLQVQALTDMSSAGAGWEGELFAIHSNDTGSGLRTRNFWSSSWSAHSISVGGASLADFS